MKAQLDEKGVLSFCLDGVDIELTAEDLLIFL